MTVMKRRRKRSSVAHNGEVEHNDERHHRIVRTSMMHFGLLDVEDPPEASFRPGRCPRCPALVHQYSL